MGARGAQALGDRRRLRKRYSSDDGEVWELQAAASRRVRPAEFGGDVLLLRTRREADRPEPAGLTGRIHPVVVDDTHFGITADGERVAELITNQLEHLGPAG